MDLDKAWQQCDKSDFIEGLYIKIESEDKIIGRLKWVREDFVRAIVDAWQHQAKQPFIPNQLTENVQLYNP